MPFFVSQVLLVLGFLLVIKGAGFFVDGASALAKKLKVSELVIGLTVVGFGTSFPELAVNILASVGGKSDIAISNIIGSNTANILLILGISAIIFPLAVTKGTVWKEIPFGLLAAVLVIIMANDKYIDTASNSALTRIDGLILLAFFVIFIYYTAGIARETENLQRYFSTKPFGASKVALFLAAGLACLVVGSKWIVDGAVALAEVLSISRSLVGFTIVAIGTSIPELATSAMAAYKKRPEIAVGNIVGSNIFNIFFILGISSIIRPIQIQPFMNIDITVCIAATMLLFIWMFTGKKHVLDRWEAILFILSYSAYVCYLVIRG